MANERTARYLRPCGHCGELYKPTGEHAWYARKYCSRECSSEAAHARTVAKYPPREEIEQAYCVEGLSDRQIGERYSHSYQWSLNVRRHYGITHEMKARRPPKRHQSAHGYMKIGNEYEHRLVMEKQIRRKLTPGEVVHHIDGDRTNNDPANLVLYPTNTEHLYDERHRWRGVARGKRQWKSAREKVDMEGRCRVCGRSGVKIDAAHIIPRSLTKPGEDEGDHPDNIVPLCHDICHSLYDQQRTLDLLPYLTLGEQSKAVELHPDGLMGAFRRLTNERPGEFVPRAA